MHIHYGTVTPMSIMRYSLYVSHNKQAVWEATTICPAPCKLSFDLLTLKVVSESRVMATCVPILVFLGLSVVDLGLMYATVRQTLDTHHCLMPLP